jgi:diguanylate cyclase (GGDEF)-like protein
MREAIRRYQQKLGDEINRHEVTAQALHQEKERVSYHARHDSLTDLVNRREFESRVIAAIDEGRRTNAQHGLLYIDLDQFKVVNDTCGHLAGDELLKQLSHLLSQHIRQVDTLARLGGDEFGVLLQHCPTHQAVNIADKLREVIQDYRFSWGGNLFSVGASVGVVMIGIDSGDIQTVFRNADAACYAAKDKGRNRIHVYRSEDHEVARRHGEMQWITRISRAVEEDRFVLYCQPIVNCARPRMRPVHYEVLVRMVDERGNIVPPGAFIPAAERYNVMVEIDRRVVRNLCRQVAEMSRDQPELGRMLWSINISGASLNNDDFLPFIAEQLTDNDIRPEQLCFEITETAAIADLADATRFVSAMKKVGCQFSLDDFGSGLSSFGYLKNLPVDYIKIDGVFVKDIVDDPIDFAMVKSINEMGHVLGVKTIAEFVENRDILKRLREIGVDFVQGHTIAKPFPLSKLTSGRQLQTGSAKVIPLATKQKR